MDTAALFGSLAFVALAVASTFLQVADRPAKRLVSPGLTAFSAAAVLWGTLAGRVPAGPGATVAAALLLLAASDFVFERSEARPKRFPLAMGLGVVSGFGFGILFHRAAGPAVAAPIHIGCIVLAVAATVAVFRRLEVRPGYGLPLGVYLLQAVVLLSGGLACLFAAQPQFAVWGILVFLSDSLVGIRAFPSPVRPLPWLTLPRLLLAILALYYPALFALVLWAILP